MRSRWPGRIVASLLCAAVVAAVAWSFRPLPVEVDLATVSRGDVLVTVDEEGRTRVRERYVVATPIGGRLRRVGLHVGDPVRRGETLLAVVDPRLPDPLDERERLRAEAQVGAARASLERTRSAVERAVLDLEHARRESDRMRRAASAAAAPGRELDLALQAERLAAEDLRSTEHARRIAEFDLALAQAAFAVSVPRDGDPPPPAPFEIRSPIDGAVLRVTLESESVVTPGAAILEVGDPADLEVTVEVLTRDAVRVVPGAEVVFAQWGGATPLEGRIRRIEPAGFTKVSALGVEEQRVLVIADLLDPPSRRATLGDAYRVEAHILVDAARGVLTAPAGALFRSGSEWTVFLAAGETVELRTVTTGRSDGRATEIVAGLAEGDRVVLHPGAEVAPGVAFVERSRAPR